MEDKVNHPKHYTSHPSGVECIQITEHLNFCVGNAIKYLWRAGLKDSTDMGLEDLKKAQFYINREIERIREAAANQNERTITVDELPSFQHYMAPTSLF